MLTFSCNCNVTAKCTIVNLALCQLKVLICVQLSNWIGYVSFHLGTLVFFIVQRLDRYCPSNAIFTNFCMQFFQFSFYTPNDAIPIAAHYHELMVTVYLLKLFIYLFILMR